MGRIYHRRQIFLVLKFSEGVGNMKKFIYGILSVAMASMLMMGCGGDGGKKTAAPAAPADKKVVVKVGATPVPHAELLNFVKPQLAKEGVDLQVIEFTDYVKPNLSLWRRPVRNVT